MTRPTASTVEPETGRAFPSRRRGANRRRIAKLTALAVAMLAVVIVPFLLFGDPLDSFARDAMASASYWPLAGAFGFLLLAADVVLPIPSTVVIALLGGWFGALTGTLVAAGGLTLGCAIGYWLGKRFGFDFAERTIGREDLAAVSTWFERHGVLVLAFCRPVPVLAEASVIAAGVANLPARKVLIVTTLANIGFAAVYALIGARVESGVEFLAALAASIALPGAAMLGARAWRRRTATP
ncbi:TVP38/TMEM64 family protein [Hyphomicrobium nitrativorans]|uniref:TVP38/TMEM64 family protein n=1 Tax=Hyphomicrobium nitrativorans TaxID=1427356 RepID=UPI00068904C8|nr:VTT domain-containing protein [Hyphomicrobium nitrativorans]